MAVWLVDKTVTLVALVSTTWSVMMLSTAAVTVNNGLPLASVAPLIALAMAAAI